MSALVVRFELTPDGGADFDELVRQTLDAIEREEPGTVLYVANAVAGDPGARVFYEVYRDRQAFDVHEAMPHTRRFLAERTKYLTCAPRVEFLEVVRGMGLSAS